MANERSATRRLPVRAALGVGLVALAGVGLWLALGARDGRGRESFTGYVVSDDIYMAPPVAGTLTDVWVKRGQRVTAGDALFRVDPTVRTAQTRQAEAVIAANRAQLAQQEAALAHARADLAAAQADADRYGVQARRLAGAQQDKPGSVAGLDLDQARASYAGALHKRDGARAQIGSAMAAVAAARAQLEQGQAGLTTARRQLDDLAPVAPSAGRVEDVMARPGETVAANSPVVAIVPDGQVKIRFYVPQSLVHAYGPGRRVAIGCDGCRAGMSAVVDFVANQPEYTPPIIYSLDARQKLVFMIEAVPSDPRAILPGQPMDVAPSAEGLPRR